MIRSMLIKILSLNFMIFSTCSFSAKNIENNIKFDQTNVLEDLNSATLEDGKKFDISYYPVVLNQNPSLLTVMEYCYTNDNNYLSNYNLYFYFYNPGKSLIDYDSSSNMVQLSIGDESNYNKYSLIYLNSSEDNVFIKFKLDLPYDIKQNYFFNNLNPDERIYSVSGFEFDINGKISEYTTGANFIYTGYSAGYGDNEDSTLSYTKEDLETVSVNPKQTLYRLKSSSQGINYQTQLNSVYFTLDNYLLEKYGNLQKIKAQWYEYKTSPIVVLNDESFYNNFNSIKGIKVYDNEKNPDGIEMEESTISRIFQDNECSLTTAENTGGGLWNCKYIFNWPFYVTPLEASYYSYNFPEITWLFYTNGINYQDYSITASQLNDYAINFNTYNFGKTENNMSRDLFLGKVDEGRKEGLNVKEFDASDNFNLLDYSSNTNAWQKFFDYFGNWWNIPDTEQIENVNPIYQIKDSDIIGDNVAENLLVDDHDSIEIENTYLLSKNEDKSTFLFRFATTEYYSESVHCGGGLMTDRHGYVAESTVFLNFDILQFTFNKDGESIVIPVVMDPVDIFSDVTPPIENSTTDYLKIIITTIATVGIIIITIRLIYKLIMLFK